MPRPKLSKDTLLEDLHRVARLRKDAKQTTYRLYGKYSLFVFYTKFGPWRHVLEAANAYKRTGIMATAANSAIRSGQGWIERKRLTKEADVEGASVPFKHYTKAEIEAAWPGRVYGNGTKG